MDSVLFSIKGTGTEQATVRLCGTSHARTAFSADYLKHFLLEEDGRLTLLVGTGDKQPSHLEWQELYATASSVLRAHDVTGFAVDCAPLITQCGTAGIADAVLGLMLGLYDYTLQKKQAKEFCITLAGIEAAAQQEAAREIKAAQAVAQGICFARDLVNMPGNMLHPHDMAQKITGLLSPLGIECETIGRDKLAEMGMNGLLLTGDSSSNAPCLLVMRYLPLGDEAGRIGLVGKGVTFDSGGYCLKPGESMTGSKGDMAGGAAVAGALYALAQNAVPANVVGVIPLCENRISNSSLLPGDVYTSYAGKTVEVLNTDAEGRLILADALTYARRDEHVVRLVDIATLTGAVVRALGFGVAGVVANNTEWWQTLERAAQTTGERYWLWPDYPEYHKMLESRIADIKNLGDPHAGSITGGLFIGSFAEETPWMHLDIAGTAWVDKPVFAFQAKGATGAGVATLYELCAQQGPRIERRGN